jgi:hypothetical protein
VSSASTTRRYLVDDKKYGFNIAMFDHMGR